MPLFFRRAAVFFAALPLLAITAACHAAGAAPEAAERQLIVKFKRGAVTCDRFGVARFSASAGVPLEFLRPMSGDACVVLQSAAGADALARGLEALRKNGAVEWAEPDAVIKTQ